MKTIKNLTRTALRRLGYDLVRYRGFDLLSLLQALRVDTVLDIGANIGQYAQALRYKGYKGRILSVEPNPRTYGLMKRAAEGDPDWRCFNIGFGDANSTAVLNTATISGFDSILQGTSYLQSLEEGAQTQTRTEVTIQRLDSFWNEQGLDGSRVFIKLDCQGYEKRILLGASQCLGNVLGIQLELSIRRIYDDQPQIEEMMPFLKELGFCAYGLIDGFRDRISGQLLEVDGFFVRSESLCSDTVINPK
jgi:FkbM family methyltransferase